MPFPLQGFVEHEFVENSRVAVDFQLSPEEEQCEEADFVKFLHYLAGCRDSDCVQVPDARTCVSLLHVSVLFNLKLECLLLMCSDYVQIYH